jgi:hypothetical protein
VVDQIDKIQEAAYGFISALLAVLLMSVSVVWACGSPELKTPVFQGVLIPAGRALSQV